MKEGISIEDAFSLANITKIRKISFEINNQPWNPEKRERLDQKANKLHPHLSRKGKRSFNRRRGSNQGVNISPKVK